MPIRNITNGMAEDSTGMSQLPRVNVTWTEGAEDSTGMSQLPRVNVTWAEDSLGMSQLPRVNVIVKWT